MKEEKRIINKLKHKTKNNQKLACSCVYYSCDRAFLMGFYNYTSTNDWWEKNYYNWEKWYLLVVIKKALILKGNKSNPSISLKIAKMLFSNQVNSGKKKNLHPPLHPSIQQQQQQQQSWGDCCSLQVAWIAAQHSH